MSEINSSIKTLLGFSPDTDDDTVRTAWLKHIESVTRPCHTLLYCPYGPLVEEFSLPTRKTPADIAKRKKELQKLLRESTSSYSRKMAELRLAEIEAGDYADKQYVRECQQACSVFGHQCPVFFVAEPFVDETEQDTEYGQ